MPALVVVGLQWGDEGKGRVIHSLARHAHAVARYQGGNNAGHTLVLGPNDILALHLVPSGIVYPKVHCYIGNGVVVDPKSLKQEIEMLTQRGVKVRGRCWVSPLSHVILPYHLQLERYLGEGSRLGTTQRGIGPSYRDKIARAGIRIIDYLDDEIFKERALANIQELLTPFAKPEEIRVIENQTLSDRQSLAPFLKTIARDVSIELHAALKKGRRVILESAQGTFLDVDFGTYPYVTSSNPVAGYAPCGVGIGPQAIEVVLGIAKLFTTRVGEGPFPTEIQDDLAAQIRETGHEYGATTGRPRRIGWLDLPLLRKACRINGVNRLALTKLDTLSGLSKIQVCVGYSLNGRILKELPDGLRALKEALPVYRELPGFTGDLTSVTRYADLPKQAKRLIDLTLDYCQTPAAIISVGRRPQNQIILDRTFCRTWM
ncbi:MAG: adenylosuccinate synthase [Elusimicrobia bacterium]|nr:adenylosuccinate synthase [Elusimicrobiota bacterium]